MEKKEARKNFQKLCCDLTTQNFHFPWHHTVMPIILHTAKNLNNKPPQKHAIVKYLYQKRLLEVLWSNPYFQQCQAFIGPAQNKQWLTPIGRYATPENSPQLLGYHCMKYRLSMKHNHTQPSKFPKPPKISVTQGTVSCVLLCRGEIPSRTLIIIILYPEAQDWIVCILTGININVTVVIQLLESLKKFPHYLAQTPLASGNVWLEGRRWTKSQSIQSIPPQGAAISLTLHTPSPSKKTSQIQHNYILFTYFFTSQVL